MGGCASVSLKDRAEADFLPPEPAKEATTATAPATDEAKGAEQGDQKKNDVVEENKGPSLGALLDEDEKRVKLEEEAAKKSKNEEVSTSAPPPPPETKPKAADETENKPKEKKNN